MPLNDRALLLPLPAPPPLPPPPPSPPFPAPHLWSPTLGRGRSSLQLMHRTFPSGDGKDSSLLLLLLAAGDPGGRVLGGGTGGTFCIAAARAADASACSCMSAAEAAADDWRSAWVAAVLAARASADCFSAADDKPTRYASPPALLSPVLPSPLDAAFKRCACTASSSSKLSIRSSNVATYSLTNVFGMVTSI